jgi:protein arginine kinase
MYELDEIWDILPVWLKGESTYSDVIISSRIRLARNLDNFPFPTNATDKKLSDIVNEIQNIVEANEFFSTMQFWRLSELSQPERQMLVERRLISPELSQKPDFGAAMFDSQNSISLMINEQDHFRLQIIDSGIELEYLWEKIHKIEQLFDEALHFSFSEDLGFLTSCPTNTGTGLRVSIVFNLPVLAFEGNLETVYDNPNLLKLTIKNYFGEENDIIGSIYQISNQLTLGWTEHKLLDAFLKIALQIVDKEQAARYKLLENRNVQIEDKVFRSLGVIERAKMISSVEFIEHYSNLKLGIELGLINKIEKHDLHELILWVQPAHLQWRFGKELNSLERELIRAEMIRTKLGL